LAIRHPEKVQGISLFAPTLWINGWAMPWYMKLFSLVRYKWIANLMQFPDAESLGIKCPRVREFVRLALATADGPEMGTTGTPAAMVLEHRWMVEAAMKDLGKVEQPTLIVHSREDDHADLNNATYLQRALGGSVDVVILDDSYHMVTLDKQRQVVVDKTRAFVDRVVSDLQALAFKATPISAYRHSPAITAVA
jgi:carboxylesterase